MPQLLPFQLKLYAAERAGLTPVPTEFIGFTLPSTSVTRGEGSEIPLESDVVIINVYSITTWTLHAVSLIILSVSYCMNEKVKV